jgi:hypothetical protein
VKNVGHIEPQFTAKLPPAKEQEVNNPFAPLSVGELTQDWAREYKIACFFAKEHDFYRAITGFKRASILIPTHVQGRHLEIQYQIILCYYQAQKYLDAVYSFEKSDLKDVGPSFPAFNDMITILYDSYLQIGETEKGQKLLAFVQQHAPDMGKELLLGSAIQQANFQQLDSLAQDLKNKELLSPLLNDYPKQRKSPRKAQLLNALLPGSGYLYLGQKQSAATAFFLNSAFIAAAYHFLSRGHTAAGIITTSFELGWYIGGINGAGLAAKEHNERLYEKHGYKILKDEKVFPLFMLQFRF